MLEIVRGSEYSFFSLSFSPLPYSEANSSYGIALPQKQWHWYLNPEGRISPQRKQKKGGPKCLKSLGKLLNIFITLFSHHFTFQLCMFAQQYRRLNSELMSSSEQRKCVKCPIMQEWGRNHKKRREVKNGNFNFGVSSHKFWTLP